jgi:CDP-glucose 4,6-dehydratase
MHMHPEFWNSKRVFITGHTGFKGSWLALWLQNAGAVITGYALEPPTVPNLFTDVRVGRGMSLRARVSAR